MGKASKLEGVSNMAEEISSTNPPVEFQEASLSEHVSINMLEERPSSEHAAVELLSTSAGNGDVLVIKDCDPWRTDANQRVLSNLDVNYDTINAYSLSNTDLSQYQVIVLPSTQSSSYYRRLRYNSEKIDSFVSNGGTLVAHIADQGWPCTTIASMSFLPRGVGKSNTLRNNLDRTTSDHPVVDGISDSELDYWGASTHGYLTNLPDDAVRVIGINGDKSRPTYAEYGHGQGTVLATMQTMEWPWAYGSGTKKLLRNELKYALSDTGPEQVSASVTTLQFIPGENENVSQGGYPLNSGLMEIFRESDSIEYKDRELTIEPVLDAWLKGDATAVEDNVRPGNDELPMKLEDARKKENGKYADEFGDEAFGIFRFENGVDISFETPDGETVTEESVEIQFNESGETPSDDRVSLKGRKNPTSVAVDNPINGIPVKEWHESFQESSNRRKRHYTLDTNFEFDGVEGVRVLTVTAGYAGFIQEWSDRLVNSPPSFFGTVWDWDVPSWLLELAWLAAPTELQALTQAMVAIPNTYTMTEFIVLADGRRYANVWDASQYPSLATYVDGERKALEKMTYQPQERFNLSMTAFLTLASVGATPYHTSLREYLEKVKNDGFQELIIAPRIESYLDKLPVDYTAEDILAEHPRETLAFTADGDPINDASAPFDKENLSFVGGDKIDTA